MRPDPTNALAEAMIAVCALQVPIPVVTAEAQQVERTRGKTWSRADPRFLCPTPSGPPGTPPAMGQMGK